MPHCKICLSAPDLQAPFFNPWKQKANSETLLDEPQRPCAPQQPWLGDWGRPAGERRRFQARWRKEPLLP
jgi:hypothetical protein